MSKRLPGRRSTTSQMSEGQKDNESKFGRCPKGHALPHRTNKGNCTPLFCAGSKPGKNTTKTVKAEAKALATTMATDLAAAEAEVDAVTMDESTTRIVKAATRHKARMAYVKVPETFPDAKARERWIEDKKVELMPYVMGDLEYSLKLGDTQERERARKEIADMAGHGKRDPGNASATPLIMLVGVSGNPNELPWVRRIDKDDKALPQTIEVPK